jgi:hypothetical protein
LSANARSQRAENAQQENRTAKLRRRALGEQGCNLDAMHGDEGACSDRVVASHRATGEDGKDGQETAIDKLAAATVGDGAISDAMKNRVLISAPPDQRATDSHDYLFLSVENSKHLAGQNIGHPLFDPVLL